MCADTGMEFLRKIMRGVRTVLPRGHGAVAGGWGETDWGCNREHLAHRWARSGMGTAGQEKVRRLVHASRSRI